MPSRSSNDDAEPLPQFTLEEVALHNSAEDCWVVVNGKVYDVTKYLDDHPGGDQVLLVAAGEDATEEFEDAGHSRDALALMEHYCIGELSTSKTDFRSQVLHRFVLPMVASIAIIGVAAAIYYCCNTSETSSERLPDASFVEDLRPESEK